MAQETSVRVPSRFSGAAINDFVRYQPEVFFRKESGMVPLSI